MNKNQKKLNEEIKIKKKFNFCFNLDFHENIFLVPKQKMKLKI